jgi:predicted nucleic acid-binding protein
LSDAQAAALIESFLPFRVQENMVALTRAALDTCQQFRISYWDAAILEAARALGCSEALSEDSGDREQRFRAR